MEDLKTILKFLWYGFLAYIAINVVILVIRYWKEIIIGTFAIIFIIGINWFFSGIIDQEQEVINRQIDWAYRNSLKQREKQINREIAEYLRRKD